jgi:hypothetical protein
MLSADLDWPTRRGCRFVRTGFRRLGASALLSSMCDGDLAPLAHLLCFLPHFESFV